MKTKKLILRMAVLCALGGGVGYLAAVTPMKGHPLTDSGCSAYIQIKEMENYGEIRVGYFTPRWAADSPTWWSTLHVKGVVKMELTQKGTTMCESVDGLYYKFLEFPTLQRKTDN